MIGCVLVLKVMVFRLAYLRKRRLISDKRIVLTVALYWSIVNMSGVFVFTPALTVRSAALAMTLGLLTLFSSYRIGLFLYRGCVKYFV